MAVRIEITCICKRLLFVPEDRKQDNPVKCSCGRKWYCDVDFNVKQK